MGGSETCVFCGERPSVVFAGKAGACRQCCGANGPVRELFEKGQRARRPDWDQDKDSNRDAMAREVGLTDDDSDDSQVALSLIESMYPRASNAVKSEHFATALGQLKLQRRRRAGRQSTQLSTAIDNFVRRQGGIPTGEVRAAVRKAGLVAQGDASTTLATAGGKPATMAKAVIGAAVRRAGLATA
jgi:hypothetical protein